MKVIAVNGSPRPQGNTYLALKTVCEGLEREGIETEIINIGTMEIKGCISCGRCSEGRCVFFDEKLNGIADKIYAADGLILGSPVYYAGINGTMKSFLDRLYYSSRGKMRHKIGASVAVCRRGGAVSTFDQLNHYFLISEMIVAPSYYWNVVYGCNPGEFKEDAEGNSILNNLSQNMSWLLKMKEATKDTLPAPKAYERAFTNFIR